MEKQDTVTTVGSPSLSFSRDDLKRTTVVLLIVSVVAGLTFLLENVFPELQKNSGANEALIVFLVGVVEALRNFLLNTQKRLWSSTVTKSVIIAFAFVVGSVFATNAQAGPLERVATGVKHVAQRVRERERAPIRNTVRAVRSAHAERGRLLGGCRS